MNGPLLARLATGAPESAVGEFMWMPGGTHSISCHEHGTGNPVRATVLCDRAGAAAIQAQFDALRAKSNHRPYFDFDHAEGPASFWPEGFTWRDQPTPGIYARGTWSDAGKAAVEGKTYRAFSPVFFVDDAAANPARLVNNPNSSLTLGGFVNDPAFKGVSPLWAKAAPIPEPPTPDHMKETVQQLEAKVATLENELRALQAKGGSDELAAARLEAKQTALENAQSKLALAAANQKVATMEGEALASRKAFADAAIQTAIKRGALAAQATAMHDKYRTLICQDAGNVFLLEQLPANHALAAGEFLTTGDAGTSAQRPGALVAASEGHRLQSREGMNNCLKAYVGLQTKNAALRYNNRTAEDKKLISLEAAMIYREAIAGKNWQHALNAIELATGDNGKALMGSDYSGTAGLGVLNGTLVAQRTLELFKYEFPLFDMLHTDFSELPANLNQDIVTRIINIPTVQLYDPTINADGEPNGWRSVTAPSTSDVKVTMNKLAGVPIRFGIDTLAQTARRLFDEQSEAGSYALGKYFIELIYTLLTPANYNSYAVANATTVPVAYPTFPKSALEFGRNAMVDAGAAFDNMAVPTKGRFALLNPTYHGQLEKDPSLIYFAAQRAPELISGDGLLPRMARFQPVLAPNLAGSGANANATANLAGYFGHKASLAIASRLVNDYTTALPGSNVGAITTITNPDIGISMNLIQFVNHQAGYAEWLLAAILGAAVGDKRGGLVLTSQ